MVLGTVVAAAVAGTTAAGVLGEAALPKELPKPPNPNGVLLPPIAVPALALKLAKLNALATGSTLAAAGMELVVVLLTLIELLLVAVVVGLTVFNASGTSFLGCSCAAFTAVPKPAKILGAAAAPAPAVLPKLKVEVPAKKDVAGFAAVSLAPIAGLIVAVVTVVAVVFTNGLLWLKLKEVGVAGVAKLDTSIVAAGLDAVGLGNAAVSASAGLAIAGAAAAACVDLWATVGLAAAAAAAAVAAAADFFFWSALSFVSSITSDLRPTRSGRCGLITCILC